MLASTLGPELLGFGRLEEVAGLVDVLEAPLEYEECPVIGADRHIDFSWVKPPRSNREQGFVALNGDLGRSLLAEVDGVADVVPDTRSDDSNGLAALQAAEVWIDSIEAHAVRGLIAPREQKYCADDHACCGSVPAHPRILKLPRSGFEGMLDMRVGPSAHSR